MKEELIYRKTPDAECGAGEVAKHAADEVTHEDIMAGLHNVLKKHPGLFTYAGTLAVESEGRAYNYKGEDITWQGPKVGAA